MSVSEPMLQSCFPEVHSSAAAPSLECFLNHCWWSDRFSVYRSGLGLAQRSNRERKFKSAVTLQLCNQVSWLVPSELVLPDPKFSSLCNTWEWRPGHKHRLTPSQTRVEETASIFLKGAWGRGSLHCVWFIRLAKCFKVQFSQMN